MSLTQSGASRAAEIFAGLRNDIVGIDMSVPYHDGMKGPYVFLDNAASTPAFRSVLNCVEEFLPWYSGVHRGTGVKSVVATELFDRAHEVIGSFVGADPSLDCVVLVKNTTEAINKLANRLELRPADLVITTLMEHHSDDLPWRKHCDVIHTGVDDKGRLDLEELRAAITANKRRLRLVAVTGASNITGICNPVHDIARWAHEAGAKIFVDAAQLAPHRPIDILPSDDPGHLDFLAFSGHKMYAPFGTGALIGPRSFFENGEPDAVGGGVVLTVSLDEVHWNSPPHKEEAGSPNVVGAIALAKAITVLKEVGMENIAEHEAELLEYAYAKLMRIRDIELFGPTDDLKGKVGVITFNVRGMHNALVAAIFGTEFGVGLRNGCFCAHPYVKKLLGISPKEDRALTAEMLAGDKSRIPGLVRASLGCYNSRDDIDRFIEALERIVRKEYSGTYALDPSTGSFSVQGGGIQLPLGEFFTVAGGERTRRFVPDHQ